ncbi:DNA mismatch repair protein, partial [Entomortierella chlamydospora]
MDRKFILCVMKSTSSTTHGNGSIDTMALAVVDQHAADQRVRVERLMKDMCTCSLTELPTEIAQGGLKQPLMHRLDVMQLIPPIPITLSKREWNLAKQYAYWLCRWGIVVGRNSASTKDNGTQQLYSSDGVSEELDSGGYHEDTILVSHHFNSDLGITDQGSGYGLACGYASTEQQEQPPNHRGKNRHTPQSDYSRGCVTVLPRIVAERCVVDTTLTQDLIKDSLSWAEENRISGGKYHTLSVDNAPD